MSFWENNNLFFFSLYVLYNVKLRREIFKFYLALLKIVQLEIINFRFIYLLDFFLKSFVSFVMFITGHHHAEEADPWRETGK